MKKTKIGLTIFIALTLLLLTASVAFAGGGNHIYKSVGECLDNGNHSVTVWGKFKGKPTNYRTVVTLDGTSNLSVGKSFSITKELGPGTYTATVVLLKRQRGPIPAQWKPVDFMKKTFTVGVCHDYTIDVIAGYNCGYYVVTAKLYDNGVHTGNNKTLVSQTSWSDPYSLESAGPFAGTVTFSPGGIFSYNTGVIYEPEKCLVEIDHWYEVEEDNGCFDEGWDLSINTEAEVVADGPTSGAWLLPYELEVSPLVTFTLTWLDGYVEVVTAQVEEAEECLAELRRVCKTLDSRLFLVDNVPYFFMVVTNRCEYWRWNTPTMSPREVDFWYNDNIDEKWVKWNGRWAKLVGVTPPHPLDSSVVWDGLPQDASGHGAVTIKYDPRPYQKALK